VDYYAVGVMVYEFMKGKRPYLGRNRKEIRDQILSRQAQIKRNEIPEDWSPTAASFANDLIQRKPMSRLGVNGPQEVKAHPWLRDINWVKLKAREIVAPFIPPNSDNYD
jgi:serine/threonine protein kinase